MASNETSGPPPGKEREQDKKDKHTKIETNSSKTNLIPWRMPQPYCSTLETLSRYMHSSRISFFQIFQIKLTNSFVLV